MQETYGCTAHPSFIKWFGTGVFVLVLVYVDDFLMLSPSGVQLEEAYQAITSLYEIRRMKEVNLYLRVELRWSKRLGGAMMLHMLQPTYIKSMLVRYGMQYSRPASQLQCWSHFFAHLEAEEDTTVVELNLYQQLIGSLLYLALKTRPDNLTAVCVLSRFTSAPIKYCHMGVNRVFRYLQGTIYLALEYCSSDIKMNVFVDSDYAGDTNSRKSTSGMAIFLGSSLIQWHSKKQSAVSLSTCEAEYQAMTEATKDPMLFKPILEELNINVGGRTPMHSDNKSAIAWATGVKPPGRRAKHVDVSVHYIRDFVENDGFAIPYVIIDDNKPDGFTKPLGKLKFHQMVKDFGMVMVQTTAEEEC
jgi:hypothetical protein